MKIRNDFTLYFRVVPSGKRVVYYYTYNENGERLPGRSTGETTLTAARVKCNKLLKEGTLVPKKGNIPIFAEYAKDWWDWENCEYLKKRRKRHILTQAYAELYRRNLINVILPYFGKVKIDKITSEDIERFLDYLIIEKKYKNATANSYFGTLKTMLKEAVNRNLIAQSPAENIGKLLTPKKEIKIITTQEFKKLFTTDWRRIWGDNRIAYTANKLAALTGMRAGEVLGLKGCYVYEGHIFVCKQYGKYGYQDTKTRDKHNIPLPDSLIDELNELKKINGDGFLFSVDGGAKPVSMSSFARYFRSALQNIEISKKEIAARKLSLHGWRHFFNTEMLKSGLSIPQAQAVTGHRSRQMTELYFHFDPAEFAKAKEVQETLLKPAAS